MSQLSCHCFNNFINISLPWIPLNLLYNTSLACFADWCVGVCPVLCSAPVMNDIVVMDVHQHGDGLSNDE